MNLIHDKDVIIREMTERKGQKLSLPRTNLNRDGRDADRRWIGILVDECRLGGW